MTRTRKTSPFISSNVRTTPDVAERIEKLRQKVGARNTNEFIRTMCGVYECTLAMATKSGHVDITSADGKPFRLYVMPPKHTASLEC